MAPMFLVSNEEMIISAFKAGISAAIPALNYRTEIELRFGIRRLKEGSVGSFGINLIVNKSNLRYPAQLKVCCEEHVNFIITSLGSPLATIKEAKNSGIKVFCDVTDIEHAKKVEQLGADAIIAVNNRAGGHAGNLSPEDLIVKLKSSCSIPIISAGGVGCGSEMKKLVSLGADGFSIGSIFIASTESGVSEEYKRACVDYGARDIVMTTKLSGTPCTVINTPYVQKIGTQQTWIERVLNKNKRLKKWFKAFTFYKGIKSLEKAAFSATYKNVWCAGPSIEHVKEILPVEEIVRKLIDKYNEA
ncbi:MAG TPA: nitronate monooxygenase [Oligoflexia bacterium]|nr:nitronate monooxygenase [Oligoflexia bacterium]HMP47185.1 nitronate monooxygenase [Oligoflexia bacterium]